MIFVKEKYDKIRYKIYVSHHLPILTLFILLSDMLPNVYVIKKLQRRPKLFCFILRNQQLKLILMCDISLKIICLSY